MQQSKVEHKPVLILLSDLWGEEKSGWIENYGRILNNHFEIKYYDSCGLELVDRIHYSGQNGTIHKDLRKLTKHMK